MEKVPRPPDKHDFSLFGVAFFRSIAFVCGAKIKDFHQLGNDFSLYRIEFKCVSNRLPFVSNRDLNSKRQQTINCFNTFISLKFLILLGCYRGHTLMQGFKITSFGMITVSLDVRIVNVFVFAAI